MARLGTARLTFVAFLACAESAMWIHQVLTGKADCSGADVNSEGYFAQDYCFKVYGGAHQTNTCNSTNMIVSVYEKTDETCAGTPTTTKVYDLCISGNGVKSTCGVSNPMATVKWSAQPECAGDNYEAQEPLGLCVKTGSSASKKAECADGVFVQKTFASADCSGTANFDYTGEAGMDSANATHCLGPIGKYKEYAQMTGGCTKPGQTPATPATVSNTDGSTGMRPVLAALSAPLLATALL